MLIDWFTVIAQIVNFLILVGLLKYFLYDRILSAMDAREEKIRHRLEEADSKREAAEELRRELEEKKAEMERRRGEMIQEAREAADQRRREWMDAAREAAESARDEWSAALARRREGFLRKMRELSADQVRRIGEKAFRDLAETEVEDQAVKVFLDRLKKMDAEGRDRFASALAESGKETTVVSGFSLGADRQERTSSRLREAFDEDINVAYEVSPELIFGIELRARGHKIGWSMAGYLAEMSERVSEAFEGESRKAPEVKETEASDELKAEAEASRTTGEARSRDGGSDSASSGAGGADEARKEKRNE